MEKRANTRVEYAGEASVAQGGTTVVGEVVDLSLKGMFLKSDRSLQVGADSTVTLDLAVGDEPPVHLKLDSEVVRSADGGVGVLFKEMDLDTFTHLRQVVGLNAGDPELIIEEFNAQVAKNSSGG